MAADDIKPVAEKAEAKSAAVKAEAKLADVKKLTETGPALGRTTIETGAPAARPTVEKTVTDVTKATEGLFKAAEDVAEFSRGNAEAVAKATQLYVAGVQDLSKQTLALFQGLSETAIENAKAFAAVKSLKEATELHAAFTKAALEKTFAESAKLQEAALKLAETSFAPLSARVTVAVEKFSKPLAA